MRYPRLWQLVLLWLSFFLFAPLAQAHEGHEHQHQSASIERIAAPDLSAFTLPCGGGDGPCACCDSNCCIFPDAAKVPVALYASFFSLPKRLESQPIVTAQFVPNTIPLIATAAPRAPPFSH